MQISINRRDRTLMVDGVACPFHPDIEAALGTGIRAFDEFWRLTLADGTALSSTLLNGRAGVGVVTDWSAIVAAVAPHAARSASAARIAAVKGACRAGILAVLSDATQKNFSAYGADLAFIAATGTLTAEQQADASVLRAARGWIDAMIAASRAALTDNADPVWPAVPAGVADLAQRF